MSRLTFLEAKFSQNKFGQWLNLYFCVCGGLKLAMNSEVTSGRIQSCGCLKKENAIINGRKGIEARRRAVVTHDLSKTKSFRIWAQLFQRCYNKNNPGYKWYGARGIRIDSQWLDFANFYKDMGERPIGTTLDRINNNGNYGPGNCRWASRHVQSRNKRTNIFLKFQGVKMICADWDRCLGLSRGTVRYRMRKGWSIEDIIFRP